MAKVDQRLLRLEPSLASPSLSHRSIEGYNRLKVWFTTIEGTPHITSISYPKSLTLTILDSVRIHLGFCWDLDSVGIECCQQRWANCKSTCNSIGPIITWGNQSTIQILCTCKDHPWYAFPLEACECRGRLHIVERWHVLLASFASISKHRHSTSWFFGSKADEQLNLIGSYATEAVGHSCHFNPQTNVWSKRDRT